MRWLVISALLLSGCSAPCFYKGKAVSPRDAQNMKNLGMDVQCP